MAWKSNLRSSGGLDRVVENDPELLVLLQANTIFCGTARSHKIDNDKSPNKLPSRLANDQIHGDVNDHNDEWNNVVRVRVYLILIYPPTHIASRRLCLAATTLLVLDNNNQLVVAHSSR